MIRYAAIAAILALVSCAHYPDVRPGASGQHSVSLAGDDEDELSRQAIRQARDYCKDVHEKSAAIVSEDKKYIGDMDETSYKTAKRAAGAAKALGSAGAVFGGEQERRAGGVVGLGGVIGDVAIGEGYRVTMKFKCQ
ncbi:MAG: hypothetical protein RIQ81_1036 [Pseudomonadota bacterium]|jgi:hypothetical protein